MRVLPTRFAVKRLRPTGYGGRAHPRFVYRFLSLHDHPIRIMKKSMQRAWPLYAPQAHAVPRETVGKTPRFVGSGESVGPAGRAGRRRPAASKAERVALTSWSRCPRQHRWRPAGTDDSPPTVSRPAPTPHQKTPSARAAQNALWHLGRDHRLRCLCRVEVSHSGMRHRRLQTATRWRRGRRRRGGSPPWRRLCCRATTRRPLRPAGRKEYRCR